MFIFEKIGLLVNFQDNWILYLDLLLF